MITITGVKTKQNKVIFESQVNKIESELKAMEKGLKRECVHVHLMWLEEMLDENESENLEKSFRHFLLHNPKAYRLFVDEWMKVTK